MVIDIWLFGGFCFLMDERTLVIVESDMGLKMLFPRKKLSKSVCPA